MSDQPFGGREAGLDWEQQDAAGECAAPGEYPFCSDGSCAPCRAASSLPPAADQTTQIPELQVLCGAQYRGEDMGLNLIRRCTMPAGHGIVEDADGELWDHGDRATGDETAFYWIAGQSLAEAEVPDDCADERPADDMRTADYDPQKLADLLDDPAPEGRPIGLVEFDIRAVRLSLFCWACNGVHTLSAEDNEVLVYTLIAWIGDLDGGGRAVDADLGPVCLLEAIRGGGSAEGYAEHVEQGIACRIVSPEVPE